MIEPIQHLRALAAMGVVVFHALALLQKRTGVDVPYHEIGAAGVDLFFVISGFIMWVTAISRDERPMTFVRKRITRIVPLYWLITTFILLVVIIKPELMNSASHDVAHFVASYLFIAWPHPAVVGAMWPPLIPGWTLNYEMFFYAIVTLSLFVVRAWRLPLIATVLVALPLVGYLLEPSALLEFYTSSILLEFLFGVIIGWWFTRGGVINANLSLCLVFLSLLTFFTVGLLGDDYNRVLPWGLPLALLVVGSLNAPALLHGKARAFSKLLGDSSYSLYLTQFIVLPPSVMVLGAALDGALLVAGLIGVAVVTGLLSYLLIEKPIHEVLSRYPLNFFDKRVTI